MSELLERLSLPIEPVFRSDSLLRLGEAARMMRRLGVLVRVEDATRIECPNPCSRGCGLRVIADSSLAVCPAGRMSPILLGKDDLKRYALRFEALARRLAHINGLIGRVRREGRDVFRLGWREAAVGGAVWLVGAQRSPDEAMLRSEAIARSDSPAVVLLLQGVEGLRPPGQVSFIDLSEVLSLDNLMLDWRRIDDALGRVAAVAAAPLLRITGLPPGVFPSRTQAMVHGSGRFAGLRKPIGAREMLFLSLFADKGSALDQDGTTCVAVSKEIAIARFIEWARCGQVAFHGADTNRPEDRLSKMWREFVRQMEKEPLLKNLFVRLNLNGKTIYVLRLRPDTLTSEVRLLPPA